MAAVDAGRERQHAEWNGGRPIRADLEVLQRRPEGLREHLRDVRLRREELGVGLGRHLQLVLERQLLRREAGRRGHGGALPLGASPGLGRSLVLLGTVLAGQVEDRVVVKRLEHRLLHHDAEVTGLVEVALDAQVQRERIVDGRLGLDSLDRSAARYAGAQQEHHGGSAARGASPEGQAAPLRLGEARLHGHGELYAALGGDANLCVFAAGETKVSTAFQANVKVRRSGACVLQLQQLLAGVAQRGVELDGLLGYQAGQVEEKLETQQQHGTRAGAAQILLRQAHVHAYLAKRSQESKQVLAHAFGRFQVRLVAEGNEPVQRRLATDDIWYFVVAVVVVAAPGGQRLSRWIRGGTAQRRHVAMERMAEGGAVLERLVEVAKTPELRRGVRLQPPQQRLLSRGVHVGIKRLGALLCLASSGFGQRCPRQHEDTDALEQDRRPGLPATLRPLGFPLLSILARLCRRHTALRGVAQLVGDHMLFLGQQVLGAKHRGVALRQPLRSLDRRQRRRLAEAARHRAAAHLLQELKAHPTVTLEDVVWQRRERRRQAGVGLRLDAQVLHLRAELSHALQNRLDNVADAARAALSVTALSFTGERAVGRAEIGFPTFLQLVPHALVRQHHGFVASRHIGEARIRSGAVGIQEGLDAEHTVVHNALERHAEAAAVGVEEFHLRREGQGHAGLGLQHHWDLGLRRA
eukprot:scaffold343_cov245-Pinguiococcus_pyrenoidosus.AAC.28